jgi:small basic protein
VLSQVLEIGVVALPASIGVGILRYRLYDIDRIISRTLAYAIVTGLLIGVYVGLVLLTQQVLRFHSTVAVAIATLAAAALFAPVRRQVQRTVDRRFNRARYDADQMVTVFAAHDRVGPVWGTAQPLIKATGVTAGHRPETDLSRGGLLPPRRDSTPRT